MPRQLHQSHVARAYASTISTVSTGEVSVQYTLSPSRSQRPDSQPRTKVSSRQKTIDPDAESRQLEKTMEPHMKQNGHSLLPSSATAASGTVFAGLINTPGVAGANTTAPGTTNPGTTAAPAFDITAVAFKANSFIPGNPPTTFSKLTLIVTWSNGPGTGWATIRRGLEPPFTVQFTIAAGDTSPKEVLITGLSILGTGQNFTVTGFGEGSAP